jgi:tRNA A-37 threonylcarbamoyl transferase component Bud32
MDIELSGYKIKKLLGQGAMSYVFLAYEKKLKRQVALKVLRPALVDEKRTTRRFLREARTTAQLQHSNIVSVFDVAKQKNHVYISMEYLKLSLKERMRRQSPPIKPKEALHIIKEVARALSYAHQKGFVHRDVKPDNIMFRDDGAVVLVDFGIVKALNTETRLTKTGYAIGTPEYMSPEQIKSPKIDGRADIYSLGVILFELLTGRVPFQASDFYAVAQKHIDAPIPRLPKRFQPYQQLIDRMMAKSPRKRVQTAAAVIKMVEELLEDLGTRSTSVEKKVTREAALKHSAGSRIKRVFLYIFLALIVIGFFWVGRTVMQRSKDRRDWLYCQTLNTVEGYQGYLKTHPMGMFVQDARKEISKLNEKKDRINVYQRLIKKIKENLELGQPVQALNLIIKAKEIESNQEIYQLEELAKARLQQLNDDKFNNYLTLAKHYFKQGNLKTARELVIEAKKIKITPDLRRLENLIKDQQ